MKTQIASITGYSRFRKAIERTGILLIALSQTSVALLAQSAPATAVSTAPGNETATQLAVPGGVGATVTPTGTPSTGPIIGFQVWQQDRYLLSSFFTFSVPQTFTGQPPVAPQTVSAQQNSFGALLLNPPGQGTSYTFIGNKTWGIYPTGNTKGSKIGLAQCKDCTVADGILFFGPELRGGITNATWTESTSTPQSLNATVAYLAPEFLMTSKTYSFQSGSASASGDPAQTNQYQFGVAAGPSFRFIGGDVAQKENATFLSALLGTTKTHMAGAELTFFVRMNQFKPYVRFSHFPAPNGVGISGFSGSQFVFGVDVLSPLFQTSLGQ